MKIVKIQLRAYNLYARVEKEVDSLAMQNKLYEMIRYAVTLEDDEECMHHLQIVENTLDTLDTD